MATTVLNEPNLVKIADARMAPGRNAITLRSVRVGDWQLSTKLYRPGAVLPEHQHDYASTSFVLAGALEECAEGRRDVGRAMSWVRKPAGTVHANRIGRDGAHLLELVHLGSTSDLAMPYGWQRGSEAISHWLALDVALCGGTRPTRTASTPGGFEDLAALLDDLLVSFVGTGPGAEQTDRRHLPPPWLRRVLRGLRDEDDASTPVSAIARDLGLHPVYVARVFRRTTGRTISQYRRRIRVERAAARLGRPRRSIAEIAAETGFADQAHLTRAFRLETGLTPAVYRTMVLGGTAEPEPERQTGPTRRRQSRT